MRSGQDFIRSPKLSPADAIELAIFFASTPITHFLTVLDPQILAGAEGFEPPSSVLETDSLTVELTPLYLSAHRMIGSISDRPMTRCPDNPIYFTSLCGWCLRHR